MQRTDLMTFLTSNHRKTNLLSSRNIQTLNLSYVFRDGLPAKMFRSARYSFNIHRYFNQPRRNVGFLLYSANHRLSCFWFGHCFLLYFERFTLTCHVVLLPVLIVLMSLTWSSCGSHFLFSVLMFLDSCSCCLELLVCSSSVLCF